MPPQSPAARRAAASAHAAKGRDAQAVGQFTDAIREFNRAYSLVPNPDYLFDLAQAHRRNGDLSIALTKYELYLSVQPRGSRAKKARNFIRILKKTVAKRGGPGRRGHEKCALGQWLWGGSCSPTSTFTSMARRKSRMFFGTSKDCPPNFTNRAGTYCFVCPSGQYWNTGGSCTSSCSGSTNSTERKCEAAVNPVVSPRGGPSGRTGHSQCSSGQWEWGGSCTPTSRFLSMAQRQSRMFFGTHKACPPGFLNRSSTYCYVCPSGQYWTSGGSCVSSCSGGTDYAQRKCKLGISGGVVGGIPSVGTIGGSTPRKFGHGKCPPNKWEWGGSCDEAPYYYKLAQRKSRIYFSQSKSCPPGLTYRSGNHCYTCPSGKFWNTGGSCTYSCASGSKNYTERSCNGSTTPTRSRSGNTVQGYSVGRQGHTSCPVGKWKWGGSCDNSTYFTNLARRRSRIFMGSGKTCVPGLSYRSGDHCYVCPSGKFWNTGGSCTYSCSGGKNYSERKCGSSGSTTRSRAGRRGHESCPAGKYKWGGKCDAPSYFYSLARRRSRIYFASGKDCPPGLSHRSSTYCYVCPSGKFWNTGGSCTYSCAGGKNYSERKCR